MPPRPYLQPPRPLPRNTAEKILQVAKELQDMMFQKGISVDGLQKALDIVKDLQKEIK